MRFRPLSLLLIAFALMSVGVTGSLAAESDVFGPGQERLRFDGPVDEHGLVWVVHEPNRTGDPWVIAVKNASQTTYSDIVGTLEIQLDGKWFLASLRVSENLVLPFTLEPGEIGFIESGAMGGGQDWDETRVVVESIQEGPSAIGVSLPVSNVTMGSNGFSGDITNDSGVEVTHLLTEIYCVDQSGHIYLHAYATSDLRVFRPGAVEEFNSARILGQCETADDVIVTASARTDQ